MTHETRRNRRLTELKLTGTMQVSCSMCGKEKAIPLGTVSATTTVERIIGASGWIVQQNGKNLDTYCSQKCAR